MYIQTHSGLTLNNSEQMTNSQRPTSLLHFYIYIYNIHFGMSINTKCKYPALLADTIYTTSPITHWWAELNTTKDIRQM